MIEKRGSKWRASVEYVGTDGHRHRLTRTVDTRRDAKTAEAELLAERAKILSGVPADSEEQTFRGLVAEYERWRGCRTRVLEKNASHLKYRLAGIADMKVSAITRPVLARLQGEIEQSDYSTAVRSETIQLVRSVFAYRARIYGVDDPAVVMHRIRKTPDEVQAGMQHPVWTPEQMEMYQVYRQTMGNKPLLFGGGSPDMGNSEDLTGVEFVNGTRPGNPALVELAQSQVGNVGGYPYWSWYGFDSRVEWCACFVSWCYGQAGLSEPRFAGCQSQGVPWFQSHGQWGGRGYENIAPGDAIFFDWDLDGSADHVGIVIGTDGSRVYTVEGNSGDACKIKSYDLNYESIKGYGLMNW